MNTEADKDKQLQNKSHNLTQLPPTPYAQQLIDNLSRRSRNLSLANNLLILLAVGLGVAALMTYQQKQFTLQAWESTKDAQKSQQLLISELQQQLQTAKAEVQQNAATQSSTADSEKKQMDQLRLEKQRLSAELETAKEENQHNLEKLKTLEIENKQLQDEIAKASNELVSTIQSQQEHASSLTSLQQRVTSLQASTKQLKAENAKLTKEVKDRKSGFDALARRNKALSQQLQSAERLANEFEQKYKVQNQSFLNVKQQNLNLQSTLSATQAKYEKLKKEHEKLQKSLDQLVGKSPSSTPSLVDIPLQP